MTFQEYLIAVIRCMQHNPSYRMGQCYFNVFHDHFPEHAEAITGSWLDPFHHDDRIPAFLADIHATVKWEEIPF